MTAYLCFAHSWLSILHIWNYFLNPYCRCLLYSKIVGFPALIKSWICSLMLLFLSHSSIRQKSRGAWLGCMLSVSESWNPSVSQLYSYWKLGSSSNLIPFLHRLQFSAVIGPRFSLICWLSAPGSSLSSLVLPHFFSRHPFYPKSHNTSSPSLVLNLSDFCHQTNTFLCF